MRQSKQPPPLDYPNKSQPDLPMPRGPACPTCGAPWKGAAVRVCRLCGQVIRRGERYRVVPAGPGLFGYQHREPCTSIGHQQNETPPHDDDRSED